VVILQALSLDSILVSLVVVSLINASSLLEVGVILMDVIVFLLSVSKGLLSCRGCLLVFHLLLSNPKIVFRSIQISEHLPDEQFTNRQAAKKKRLEGVDTSRSAIG